MDSERESLKSQLEQERIFPGQVSAGPGPRIVLSQGLLGLMARYVGRFHQARGLKLETGGMLVGRFAAGARPPVFRLGGFIGAGPNADFTPDSVLFDADYQARTLEALRLEDPSLANLGCIHVHPDRMDVCSQGDWLADVQAVRASDTRALVFGIITLHNRRRDPRSLFYENYKFDFFVLSEASGFVYQHVRPTVVTAAASRRPMPGAFLRQALTGGLAPHQRHCAWRPRLLKDKHRLVAEVRAMEERYGGRATLRLENHHLYWEYTVVESGRRFPIQVRYPRRYPYEPPHIISVLPLPNSPHQLPGNELCWTNRLGACDWNPARDTAATCIHAAHRWFACLLVYRTLGKWPLEADDDVRFAA